MVDSVGDNVLSLDGIVVKDVKGFKLVLRDDVDDAGKDCMPMVIRKFIV